MQRVMSSSDEYGETDASRHVNLHCVSSSAADAAASRWHHRALHIPHQGSSGVERELCRHAVAGRRIEPVAEHVWHHEHVGIGLEARRQRPQHFLLVEHVHVLVNRHDQLEIGIKPQEQHQGMARLTLGELLHREIGMEMRARLGKVERPSVGTISFRRM